uniref:Uncharacterized protein n=1 Tax=Parascaris equorum TaxID=6256 RepID=A0A914RS35_PAREQ
MTNEKVDLIQKVDHRTDDRAAKGNDLFTDDNTLEDTVSEKKTSKILRQAVAPTSMNLQEIHERKRNYHPYVTYYNQVCTGISVGMLHGATMKSAANHCAALKCEATNAKPEGGGRYEVVFLKKVDGRRSKAGSYCVSGLLSHYAHFVLLATKVRFGIALTYALHKARCPKLIILKEYRLVKTV